MTKEEMLAWSIDAIEKMDELFRDRNFNMGVRRVALDASVAVHRLRLLLEFPEETEFVSSPFGNSVVFRRDITG